ncbi:hypothetical protein ASPACDRAFT_122671 [Aspergillus aculeatus ATCC 16872]|uniref:DUF159 domain protein n=1 Tax=Aspergillus aculeatus (strain ATCC 16872 / CBS 172.66 / WB 5094) TaxID=690307 RepID=A0A1L9WP31_ASPA1|nr:uncharacterized protein ASPACDRAFT_122671 [Aspergillus aculeatus ATCC 16872]OJJ97914.1 hypothetical protein ASPACDRAFT_122671 [Aspergillus aculeatus ATCC 16872]
MCGRYALGVRMNFVQRRLQEQGMPVDEVPDDDEVRETYNFAPGNNGAVYRVDTASSGAAEHEQQHQHQPPEHDDNDSPTNPQQDPTTTHSPSADKQKVHRPRYKIQSMRWGLIPFWTKRKPDYGSLMRTINCRDDSLLEDRGMWTSMKRKKRCVIVCQGFFEWLKKGPGGKEKVPHFVRRRDGDLMCFAGLWDCVRYEGSDEDLYTFTIITTSSNSYLRFLHDRMPVILEPNSEEMNRWLDPGRTTWSKELQAMLKPYEGELECYQVPKEVGKVGNNSPDFIVPVSSKENKSNIANFFANAKKAAPESGDAPSKEESDDKTVKDEPDHRDTVDTEWTEDNAPLPATGVKREHPAESPAEVEDEAAKRQKTQPSPPASPDHGTEQKASPTQAPSRGKQMRSATHNQKPAKKPQQKRAAAGTQPITNFFQK